MSQYNRKMLERRLAIFNVLHVNNTNREEEIKLYTMNESNKMINYLSNYIDIKKMKNVGIGFLTAKSDYGLYLIDDKWFLYEKDDWRRMLITGPYSFYGVAYFFMRLFF